MSETTGRYLSGHGCGDEQPEPGAAGFVMGEAQFVGTSYPAEVEREMARNAREQADADIDRLKRMLAHEREIARVAEAERDQARADLAEARGLIEVEREAARIAREKAQYNYREAKRQHELWDHEHRQWLAAVGERQRAERERDEARRALAAAEAMAREALLAEMEDHNGTAATLDRWKEEAASQLATARRWAKRWKAAAREWRELVALSASFCDAVAQDYDAAREQVKALRAALEGMMPRYAELFMVAGLGDPAESVAMQDARAALAAEPGAGREGETSHE